MPTLRWLTRDEDVRAADKVPYKLLEEVLELGHGDRDSGNMLIHGDNLEALKALLPYYAGQVKCIYIDPPFNTGQAFDHYDDNLEHSIWLGLMFARLELLHELLAEDGTIVVHLDDEELAYAMVMMDEVFGRRNRLNLCTFKQSSVSGPKAINPGVVSISSYLFSYAKDKSRWKSYRAYRPRERDSRYSKFILQRDNPDVSQWSAITLNEALEEHFGDNIRELKRKFNVNFEKKVSQFVIDNRASVVRTARVKEKDISADARPALRQSSDYPGTFFEAKRPGKVSQFFWNGEQVAFYETKVQKINGSYQTAERVSDLWDDLLSNNLHKEGGVKFPKGKKPEALLRRVFELYSKQGDLVLDSFLGSGTTAAVAHKMNRHYIGIEMGDHAITHCRPRLQRVVDGDQSGVSKVENWQGGGGFRFYRLGESVFTEDGQIQPNIRFPVLAAHIWFAETGSPWTQPTSLTPFLGHVDGQGFALLYNGILGDKSVNGGNVLTRKTLAIIRESAGEFEGSLTIYGERTALSNATLKAKKIEFKQTPYDVKARK